MKIYITHCSAAKRESLKGTSIAVTPQELYTSSKTQCFMRECIKKNVEWAIFSDKYGVWFPGEKHIWYEKHPDSVTEDEFTVLLSSFNERLAPYDQIWFYRNPGRFHSLYERLINETELHGRITKFSKSSYIGL